MGASVEVLLAGDRYATWAPHRRPERHRATYTRREAALDDGMITEFRCFVS